MLKKIDYTNTKKYFYIRYPKLKNSVKMWIFVTLLCSTRYEF
jgi:hypothetical protein